MSEIRILTFVRMLQLVSCSCVLGKRSNLVMALIEHAYCLVGTKSFLSRHFISTILGWFLKRCFKGHPCSFRQFVCYLGFLQSLNRSNNFHLICLWKYEMPLKLGYLFQNWFCNVKKNQVGDKFADLSTA